MEYNPPLSEFSDHGLVEIIETGLEQYQQEYIDQAKKELKRRKLTEDEMVRLVNEYYRDSYIPQYRQDQHHQLEQQGKRDANRMESYTIGEMAKITILTPLIIVRRFYHPDDTLTTLWDGNYKRKFWQRLFCLLIGIGLWYYVLQLNLY